MISVCIGECLIRTQDGFDRLRIVKRSPEIRRLRSSVYLFGSFVCCLFFLVTHVATHYLPSIVTKINAFSSHVTCLRRLKKI